MRLLTLLFAGMSLGSVPLCGQTVDVHTHIIIPEYVEMLKVHGAKLEETFPLPEWDAGRHIAFMDSAGIRTAMLTMPAPQPYYGDTEESAKCIRRVNEVSAKVKQQYPGRFKFCASLPLPDVDAAIREAVYALDTLKADGVKLATNSRGQYLGDEALDPLMQILNERHAVIIIHPHRPTPYPEKIIATTPLAMYEYPAETTRAVVNMLSKNVLLRYPNLKVVVPHCGAFLPLALPRMKSILPAMVALGRQPVAPLLRLGGQSHHRGLAVAAHYHHARPYPLWLGLSLFTRCRAEKQPAKTETDARIGRGACRICGFVFMEERRGAVCRQGHSAGKDNRKIKGRHSRFKYFFSNSSVFLLPHSIIASMIGINVMPKAVMAYSERGGSSG